MNIIGSGRLNLFKEAVKSVFIMLASLALATLIAFAFRYIGFQDANIVLIYLLAVLFAAWLTQRIVFGILSSILATFLFYYFFVLPYFGFEVNDPNYWITFITMTVTALVTSLLTSHAKRSATEARKREVEVRAMYDLTKQLVNAENIRQVSRISVSAISGSLCCPTAFLLYNENGQPETTYLQQETDGKQAIYPVEDATLLTERMARLQTEFDAGSDFYNWPVSGSVGMLGIIRIPTPYTQSFSKENLRLLGSMIESIALAIDRLRSFEAHTRLREETEKERYRATLLLAISHDLRTPLSGIMGAAEILESMLVDSGQEKQIVHDIYKDADWLHSMVVNILSLTRLRDGKMALEKSMEALEEVIGGAVHQIKKRNPDYKISVSMPDDVLLLPMDARLIQQVFINLLDNAVRHTAAEEEISITVAVNHEQKTVEVQVADAGEGIHEQDLPHLFQQFYTTHAEQADFKQGVGLGLAICDTIIKSHGGTIIARNRADTSGAEFIFTLPMEEPDEHIQ